MNKGMPIIEHDFRMKVYDMTDKELHQEIAGQWFATKDFDEDQMNILIEELSRRNKAHEALDRMVAENQRLGLYDDAMDKQGPVAYRCWNNHKNADGTFDTLRIWASLKPEGYGNEPLYIAPQKREWVGLTTAEVIECQEAYYYDTYANIEAKLKEKNT